MIKIKVKNKTPHTKWIAGVELPGGSEKDIDLSEDQEEYVRSSYKFSVEKVSKKNIDESEKESVEEDSEEDEDKDEFVCDECGEAFSSEKGLKLHKTKVH